MHSKRIIQKVKEDYDEIGSEFSETRRRAWPEFQAVLPYLKPGVRVLDLGCGNGRFLDFLKAQGIEFEYLGVDQSAVLLKEAHRCHPTAEFLLAEMSEVSSLVKERFDLIVAFASFHHLPKTHFLETLKSWSSHLEPNGVLIMSNWNLFQWKYFSAWLKMLFSRKWGFKGLEIAWKDRLSRYYYAFTLNELISLHRQAGFFLKKAEKTRFNFLTVAQCRTLPILGLEIPPLTLKEAKAALEEAQLIFTPNPEMLLATLKHPGYLEVLKKGTLLLPDGNGLRIVSTLLNRSHFWRALLLPFSYLAYLFYKRLFSAHFPELIHGSDFMEDLIVWAKEHHKSVFFLGAFDGAAQGSADFFKKKYSSLKVAGVSELNPDDSQTFELVKASKADVVLVAYGAPKQEQWILEASKKCPQVIHFMGVGGSFDFWSGRIQRAPLLFRRMGLEWLWRLFQEPRKRFKRIWNAFVVFPIRALFY